MKFSRFSKIFLEIDDKQIEKYTNYLIAVCLIIFAFIYYPLWLTHEELLSHDAIMWFGSYYYTLDSFMNGNLPLWDTYGQSGNSFYQNINFMGFFEPISLFYFLWAKIWSASILYSFIYMHITRIVFMSVGVYLSYKYISGSKLSAKVGAVVFFMSIFSSSLHQNGFVNLFMTMPWILYFSLKYLDNINQSGSAKYLYAATVSLGIAFNMYIPVYTIFYLFVFYVTAILTKAINLPSFNVLFSRKSLKEFTIAILILLLFSAIPLSIFLNDLTGNGELYPYLRSYMSNNAVLEKIMVSDITRTALSDQHHKEDQISGTFLNLVQLIAPYYWKIRWQLLMTKYFQETFQFIGIISILVIICTVRFKSRFRSSVILTTVAIAMLMTANAAWGQSEIWHSLFKIIFPPLRLIKVYESFLGGHLFNLGLLLSIGLSSLEKKNLSEDLFKKRFYIKYFIASCLLIYLLSFIYIQMKIADTKNMEMFLNNYKVNLRMHLQTLVYFTAVLSMLYLIIYNRKSISYYSAYYGIVAIVLFELIVYNGHSFRKIHLSLNYLKNSDPVVHQPKPDIYDNFRTIYVPAYFRFVTFQEALQKKGAALPDIFHWMGNVVFISKRYYELITHVPKENIFAIAGVTSPKARFFESAYIANDRKDILEKLTSAAPDDLNNSLLFIETDKPQDFAGFKRDLEPYDYKEESDDFLYLNPLERITEVFPVSELFYADDFRMASREETKAYGFPKDWQLYIFDEIGENSGSANLSTMSNSNTGRIMIVKENTGGVLLNGVSEKLPVLLHSRKSYGRLTYRDDGPPLEVFTLANGKIVSTKPFDGYVVYDTLERRINNTDKEIKNLSFSPNKASFYIKNDKAGFFYYADGWSPYWKAYDNGKPVQVLKANYNYKAVFLSAGEHTVTFVFYPSHYIIALILYFSGLFGGISLIIILFVNDRRDKKLT